MCRDHLSSFKLLSYVHVLHSCTLPLFNTAALAAISEAAIHMNSRITDLVGYDVQ